MDYQVLIADEYKLETVLPALSRPSLSIAAPRDTVAKYLDCAALILGADFANFKFHGF